MLSEDAKTIHISLAIGLLEIVRYDENQINKKSARSTALAKIIDDNMKLIDQYRVNSWEDPKKAIASQVLDEIEVLINSRFSKGEV